MEFKIRQQTDLPLSIDGQNVHVIIFSKEKMVLVSSEFFDAYKLHAAYGVKSKIPDKFAMVAYHGTVEELSMQLSLRGVKFGNPVFQRDGFRTYSDFSNFDESRYKWQRWGKE